MKKIVLLLLVSLSLASCGTSRQALSSHQFRQMTTTELNAGYDTVFSATLSILQEQAFLITNADKNSGLIVAGKRIDNKYNFWTDVLLGGYVKANTSKATFLLRALKPGQTEVKLTMYAGDETVMRDDNWQQYTEKSSSIVQRQQIYQTWFEHLRHEVDVRKGIIAVEPPDTTQHTDSVQP